MSYTNDLNLDQCRKFQLVKSYHVSNFNLSPDMPILSSFNSMANKDMMSKRLTNGDTNV